MPDESHPSKFKGGLGKWYKVLEKVEFNFKHTPYTPSVIYTRAKRSRAEVWKATLSFSESDKPQVWKSALKHSGESVTIKSLKHTEGNLSLRNEADALYRLQWLNWWPPFRIAPRLYEYLKFDKASKRWFIAYEWFDVEQAEEGKAWENLEPVLEKGPLETGDLLSLQRALYKAMRLMHRLGVVHGDIKDEHVLVKVKCIDHDRVDYDFSKIRLIDYGLSYLGEVAEWRGASLGFCSPYFWHPAHRSLNKNALRWLDWYNVDALLYYALTGECFPVTSPAYRGITESKEGKAYFDELKNMLIARWLNEEDKPRKALACWAVKRLCNYDPSQTRISHFFYRRQLMFISRESAWWFVGALIIAGVILKISLVGEWAGTALTLMLLARIRWWKRKEFFILDWGLYKELDEPVWPWQKNSVWFWQRAFLPVLLSIAGVLTLPTLLYPAIPVSVGLFVNGKKSAFATGLGVLVGAIIAWMRLTLSNADTLGLESWPVALKAGPVGFLTILLSWILAFTIVSARLMKEQNFRWLLVAVSVLVAWWIPSLVGKVLLIPMQLSLTFWYAGVSSLLLSLISALFATWEHLINVCQTDISG